MLNRMMIELFRRVYRKPFTNPFPVKYMPENLTDALEAASRGEIALNPPVPVPERFRGRIAYDRAACIGCRLCIKVCPANAISFLPGEKKVEIHVDRCCFCEQCTEICPVHCLAMTAGALNSSYDRKEEVVRDSGIPEVLEVPEDAPRTVCVIDPAGCIGCTRCKKECPAGAIVGELKKPHVIDPEKCVGCGACVPVCPKKAIALRE